LGIFVFLPMILTVIYLVLVPFYKMMGIWIVLYQQIWAKRTTPQALLRQKMSGLFVVGVRFNH